MARWQVRCTLPILALSLLVPVAPARAGAIVANDTVTDLGSFRLPVYRDSATQNVSDPALTSPYLWDGKVHSVDGATAYAFPRSTVIAPGSTWAGVPTAVYTSMWDGSARDGSPSFSRNQNTGLLTANGLAVGVNNSGNTGWETTAMSMAFAIQRQADGSYGSPLGLFATPESSRLTYGGSTYVFDANRQGVVLGASFYNDGLQQPEFHIFDTATQTDTILPLNNNMVGNWNINRLLAIDDQGRILATAFAMPSPTYDPSRATLDGDNHLILLTPPGITSDPTPTPEPATWAVLGVGMLGAWLRSRRRSRT